MSDIEQTQSQLGVAQNVGQGISFRLTATVVVLALVSGFIGGFFGAQRGSVLLANQSVGGQNAKTVVLEEGSAVVDVVKKASPAVVSIVISKDLSKVPGYGADPFGGADPFAPFFGFGFGNRSSGMNRQQPSEPDVQKIGAGSGFFVSRDGLIITNKHVVTDEAASYTVLTNDRKSYEAKVLTRDPVNDFALLKIDIQNAPTLELADSNAIQIGQKVVAIGNSLGQYENTVTTGVVSGIGRSITAGGQDGSEQLEGVIQTDAAINPGNSGGPLLNILGQVIGINTAIDREGQSVGFAIPSLDAQRGLESFKKNGKITRPFLGVRYVMISPDLAKRQKLPKDYGALVVRGETATDLAVVPGGPADKAGIVENDIILEVNGQKLSEEQTLAGRLRQLQVGDTVSFKVYHRGEEKVVKAQLGESK
jgi:S1-C subfamily serine protease